MHFYEETGEWREIGKKCTKADRSIQERKKYLEHNKKGDA